MMLVEIWVLESKMLKHHDAYKIKMSVVCLQRTMVVHSTHKFIFFGCKKILFAASRPGPISQCFISQKVNNFWGIFDWCFILFSFCINLIFVFF